MNFTKRYISIACIPLILCFQSVTAQEFTSQIVKALSIHWPVVAMLDNHPTNFNADQRDGFVIIEDFSVRADDSLLVARQAFGTSENGNDQAQVWLVVAQSIERDNRDHIESLTLLLCNTSKVMVMRELPFAEDARSLCKLADTSPLFTHNASSGVNQTAQIRFSLLPNGVNIENDYEFQSTQRWIELTQADSTQLLASVASNNRVGIRAVIESTDTNGNPEMIEFSIDQRIKSNWFSVSDDSDINDNEPQQLARFEPEFLSTYWEGPTTEDVRERLEHVYTLLMNAFKKTELDNPIQIIRGGSNPEVTVVNVNGLSTYRIRLAVDGWYFQQYTFQFAHELGHILANWEDNPSSEFNWFGETIADLASAYTLTRFSQNSPYEPYTEASWQRYYNANYDSKDQRLFNQYGISKTYRLLNWFLRYLPQMRQDEYIRELNWGVAREMLPFFLENDTAWEAVGYLNRWDETRNENFYDYLESWRRTLNANSVSDAVIDHMLSILPSDPNVQQIRPAPVDTQFSLSIHAHVPVPVPLKDKKAIDDLIGHKGEAYQY